MSAFTRRWVWLALAVCGGVWPCHAQTRPRVAMMDFLPDDGLMRSAAGAAQWSALTQTALTGQEPDLDWIERAQLQTAAAELTLSVGGLTSADGSLRVGKWVKADLAILGQFTRGERDADGHTLRLEIIDLARADTLATRTIHLDGDRRDAILPDPALVAKTTAALHDALAETRQKLARAAQQSVVALLFFQNTDPSPRLDKFGSDLADAFTGLAASADRVRVLRFPQADEARGEADLAVRGLTENDPDAWQRVADFYVWGSYRELPAPDAAFAQTPVEVELTVWDGLTAPRQVKDEAAVADLPALARRLAAQALGMARPTTAARPAMAEVRDKIARSMCEQGERLEASAASHGEHRDDFLDTSEGQSLARRQRQLFEAACFFAPGNRDAQTGRLRARWQHFHSPTARLPLLDLWRRSNDLAEFADRFANADAELAGQRMEADDYLLERLHYGEDQIHQHGSEPNLPIDATDHDIVAWRAALDARFARDAAAYAKVAVPLPPDDTHTPLAFGEWMQTALQMMHDAPSSARVVEAIWPRYKAYYEQHTDQEDHRYGFQQGGLVSAMQHLYAVLHQPEHADTILGAMPAASPSPARAPVEAVDNAAPATLTRLTPVYRTIRFPTETFSADTPPWARLPGFYNVHALAVDGDGVLWISTLHRPDSGLNDPTIPKTQDFWRFDPMDDSLQKLPVDGLTAQAPITSVLPRPDGLFLTPALNGIWKYDPTKTQVTRRVTVADGLLTADMDDALAGPDGSLYFAGHENGRPLLNRCDAAGQGWMRVDLPAPAPPGANDAGPRAIPNFPSTPPITQIFAFQCWLLVRLGADWTLIDTERHKTQPLRDALPAALAKSIVSYAERAEHPGISEHLLPIPRPRPCAVDAHGFWFAVDDKLVQFDPGHPQAARSWPLPEELADGVTALAADGDDVWLAGPAGLRMGSPTSMSFHRPTLRFGRDGRGYLAVLHEADGNWRGSFELPAPVGCLAMARDTIYVDQQSAAQPILEIDKNATLTAPAR